MSFHQPGFHRPEAGPELPSVRVAGSLVDLVGPLRTELNGTLAVELGDPGCSSLAVVEAGDPDALGRLRADAPRTWILVVARGSYGERDAAAHLDVGADAYLSNPRPSEVAAQLRALERRSRPRVRESHIPD